MMYLRTVCVTSVLAHCTVIHSEIVDKRNKEYAFYHSSYWNIFYSVTPIIA